MQPVTLRVTCRSGRRASNEAFPCRAWERSEYSGRPLFQQIRRTAHDAPTGLGQTLLVHHQPDADMPRRTRAERLTGQHRHAVPLQQALGKGLGAEAGFANIDHDEYAAVGFYGFEARALTDRSHAPAWECSP